MRADAARNQERILTAARELFAERGLEVTLDHVAEHAGVGVGTVYRRFANKQDLIVAVFEERVDRLVEQAERALHHPDPWAAIVELFAYACQDMAANRGLSEVVRQIGDYARFEGIHARLEPACAAVVARGHQAGVLREGVESGDFIALMHMVDAVAAFARPSNQEVWRRYFDIVLDGLRGDALPRLPITVAPMTPDEVEAAKRACFPARK
ncbi:MAG: TetR/AcrR family transcriptional regulator [Mycobacteriaceae bacterium]|nr:TetR/AcrR family transcriptional regulator [Mycobacteriaceae bacterium]